MTTSDDSKLQSEGEVSRKKPPNAGKGRTKGVPNKTTALLKDAILMAAEKAGGREGLIGYLAKQAKKNNAAPFLALLGRVLPMQITGEDGAAIRIEFTDEQRARALAALAAKMRERVKK